MNRICFGQQPCGLFPKRFLWSKLKTARRLAQDLVDPEIVFFFHDSDHDYRETQTLLIDCETGKEDCLNFTWINKLQKKYVPLYQKRVCPEWKLDTSRRLPRFVTDEAVDHFLAVKAEVVSEFCLEYYRALGLLEGVRVVRSSDPDFRRSAPEIDDYFVDVEYQEETVRARHTDDGLVLHRGGNQYLTLPRCDYQKTQISPARDTRLYWMQQTLECTHYVAGASEIKYMNRDQAPNVTFVERDFISDSHRAYIPPEFRRNPSQKVGSI